jgi:inner membrane protein
MMFRTHIVVSLLVALIVFPMYSLDNALFLMVFLIGALFPDIDTPGSFIGRWFRPIGWLSSHRGIFHSILMLIVLSGALLLISRPLAFVFALGYATHLILDMLSYEGIRLFYPFGLRFRGFMKVDGILEKLIFSGSLVTGFLLLLR